MKYISDEILFDDTGKKNAGSKARQDVITVAQRYGYQPVHIPWKPLGTRNAFNLLKLQSSGAGSWKTHTGFLNNGDIFIFQMPTVRYLFSIDRILGNMKKRGIHVVVLIHDLESLRYEKETKRKPLNQLLKRIENNCFHTADYVVVHNQKMSEYLTQKRGVDQNKIIVLGIFDYLIDNFHGFQPDGDRSLIIAGNLSDEKAGFIQKMPDQIKVNLFGNGYTDREKKNLVYHGSFSPDQLISHLEGDFGLVWDGNVIDGCQGTFGNYMRYNNPHKTSLYLAAGIPVVIWKQAALADFVTEHKCGIIIESLDELPALLKCMTNEDYEVMQNNAEMVGDQLRKGMYLSKVFETINRNERKRNETV